MLVECVVVSWSHLFGFGGIVERLRVVFLCVVKLIVDASIRPADSSRVFVRGVLVGLV